MLLTIDAGNSVIGFTAWDGDQAVAEFALASRPERTQAELYALAVQQMATLGLDPDEIDAAVLACVVPRLTGLLERLCASLGVEPMVVGPGVRTGVPVRVENPKEVGADRIANVLALLSERVVPAIAVDFGTVLALDAISGEGAYVGSVLAPGVEIGLEAAVARTARLAWVELTAPATVIGRTTAQALQSGLIWGCVAQIEGIVARMRTELGGAARVVATGTLASTVAGLTEVIDAVDPLLTARGLRIIHELNRG